MDIEYLNTIVYFTNCFFVAHIKIIFFSHKQQNRENVFLYIDFVYIFKPIEMYEKLFFIKLYKNSHLQPSTALPIIIFLVLHPLCAF